MGVGLGAEVVRTGPTATRSAHRRHLSPSQEPLRSPARGFFVVLWRVSRAGGYGGLSQP
ncbi:hypothetical protein bb8_p07 [Bordetella phage vB_BbrP_BB8]|uniref:Uncharacterized protein n=1 Tax=Bordetella phage vB_BbrP_BB8 TaxID=2587820 RepID=A0A4Y5TNV8_9CAUD|nr:hypothetical protein bb8_p07 [Bordetella phage vB_BbrP_BB8]